MLNFIMLFPDSQVYPIRLSTSTYYSQIIPNFNIATSSANYCNMVDAPTWCNLPKAILLIIHIIMANTLPITKHLHVDSSVVRKM